MAGPATFQQYIKPAASMEDYHSLPNHLNMKNYSLAIAFGIAVVVVLASLASAQNLDKYTGKYDDVDIDAILNNDRLLNKYFECLIAEEESSCTADGKELKKSIPDALTDDCSKCSPKQREAIEKVVKFLIKNKEEMWKQLESKFDPEAVYKMKYEAQLQKIKE